MDLREFAKQFNARLGNAAARIRDCEINIAHARTERQKEAAVFMLNVAERRMALLSTILRDLKELDLTAPIKWEIGDEVVIVAPRAHWHGHRAKIIGLDIAHVHCQVIGTKRREWIPKTTLIPVVEWGATEEMPAGDDLAAADPICQRSDSVL